MTKIAFFEIESWEEPIIAKELEGNSASFSKEKLTLENSSSLSDVDILSVFIYSQLSKELLPKLPNLKCIATRSTGYDHIDLSYCKEKGITVCNVPSYGAHTVAEHAFALILAISRNIIPSVERTRVGDFSLTGLRGFDLHGKTIGVIGAGHIGQAVIEIAKGFGMKILVFTKHQNPEIHNVSFVSLDELLANSDIVTLHIPHNDETHHIINTGNITKFKKGSVLINTARGPLVETQAILEGLQQDILKAAGIDVLEEECSLKEERELLTSDFLKSCDIKTQLLNHVLLTRKNVIVTPHNAFNSTEALEQILQITGENIKGFLGGKPVNTVI